MEFDKLALLIIYMLGGSLVFILYSIFIFIDDVSGLGKHIEKLAAYECGFHPYGKTYQLIKIRYYLIAILFIIFDIEVILLIPLVAYYPEVVYCYPLNEYLNFTYPEFLFITVVFVLITLGFSYEWMKRALKWE